jgi:hypothetical protein
LKLALLRCPVFDRDTRYGGEIGILRHHDAVWQRASDSANLHVDLLNDSTVAPHFGEDAAKFLRGRRRVRPNSLGRKRLSQGFHVPLPTRTAFDAAPEFAQNRYADPNAVSGFAMFNRAFADAATSRLKVLGDS